MQGGFNNFVSLGLNECRSARAQLFRLPGYCDEVCVEDPPANGSLGACLHVRVDALCNGIYIAQGGLITITADHLDEVNNATVKFQQTVTDPKAAVLPTFNSILAIVSMF